MVTMSRWVSQRSTTWATDLPWARLIALGEGFSDLVEPEVPSLVVVPPTEVTQENVEELLPLPADFVGDGELFMLRVRGDSMIEAGILDGDVVVARAQETADSGDVVVAGLPGEEATVKTYRARGTKVTLVPANPRLEPMVFDAVDVTVYGKVVTVLRRL